RLSRGRLTLHVVPRAGQINTQTSLRTSLFSRDRGDSLVVEVSGDDGDRYREGARRLTGEGGDQRAGAFLVGARGEHEDGDVLVVLDQLHQLLGALPLAD